jgi:hypothetical protein
MPSWANAEASKKFHNLFGSSKYLWGNTPAIDIARIPENEGLTYNGSIALLFAGKLILCRLNIIETLY